MLKLEIFQSNHILIIIPKITAIPEFLQMHTNRVFSYKSASPLFSHCWSVSPDYPLRLAVCSCDLEHKNFVELIQFNTTQQQIIRTDSFQLQFPVTKSMFSPLNGPKDLLVCANDMLRIFEVSGQKLSQKSFLRHEKRRQAPITSFDWAQNFIISSSYDTALSLWDIAREELIFTFQAHEKSVNDVTFSPAESQVFASGASDGTVRVFDRRKIEVSQQIAVLDGAVLRIQFNKLDPHLLAVVSDNSNAISIFDLRNVSQPVRLEKHAGDVNGAVWNPSSAHQLLSVGEDGKALIWENGKAVMGYECGESADSCGWSELNKEWCSLVHGNVLDILHV